MKVEGRDRHWEYTLTRCVCGAELVLSCSDATDPPVGRRGLRRCDKFFRLHRNCKG